MSEKLCWKLYFHVIGIARSNLYAMADDKFKVMAQESLHKALMYILENGPQCVEWEFNEPYDGCRQHCDCGCSKLEDYNCYQDKINHLKMLEEKKENL